MKATLKSNLSAEGSTALTSGSDGGTHVLKATMTAAKAEAAAMGFKPGSNDFTNHVNGRVEAMTIGLKNAGVQDRGYGLDAIGGHGPSRGFENFDPRKANRDSGEATNFRQSMDTPMNKPLPAGNVVPSHAPSGSGRGGRPTPR